MQKIIKLIILTTLLYMIPACGPIAYMSKVGITANREFSGAKEAQAEKYSPYEYWSAYYYLHRARHKAGYADYQDANRYGQKCIDNSEKAQRRSIHNKSVEVDSGDDSSTKGKSGDSVKTEKEIKVEEKKPEKTEKLIIIKKEGGTK